MSELGQKAKCSLRANDVRPLWPQQRTYSDCCGMSEKCPEQTFPAIRSPRPRERDGELLDLTGTPNVLGSAEHGDGQIIRCHLIQFANSCGIERSAGCGGRLPLVIDSLPLRPEARLPLLPD
jgi:hypothetical protein